jgi:hypothetical protein
MLQFVPRSIWRSLRPGDSLPVRDGQTLQITDSIPTADIIDPLAGPVLNNLLWNHLTFDAECRAHDTDGILSIQFRSPLPLGIEKSDDVVLDWHLARDATGRSIAGPAVVVLDILNGGNLVAGYIAKTLAKSGIHGFVLHMPLTSQRSLADGKIDWAAFLPALRQAAGDARRARDVIAALPLVTGPIGIQGTSLGGFVATLAASIDNAFDPVVLALTGGDVFGVLTTGKMDAARVRQRLLSVGYDDTKLREWLWQIEPLRVAHRLDPNRTWLFSARFDQVVRKIYGQQLASTIGLGWHHHRQFAGCHYTCILGAPRFLSELVRAIRQRSALFNSSKAVAS